jgi:hypothetical protein
MYITSSSATSVLLSYFCFVVAVIMKYLVRRHVYFYDILCLCNSKVNVFFLKESQVSGAIYYDENIKTYTEYETAFFLSHDKSMISQVLESDGF